MRQISDNYSKRHKNSLFGRRPWLIAVVFAAMATLVACGDPAAVGTVTSVSIDQSDVTVAVGETQTLSATVVTTGNASRVVNWRSDDPDVATVSASGVVTGVAAGTATITATSRTDSSKSDSVTVTVTAGGNGGDPGEPGDPTAPTLTLTADPTSVSSGDPSTLTWTITGDYTGAQITNALGDIVEGDLDSTGSVTVNPTVSTVYTLTANYGTSSVVSTTARVAVQGAEGSPTVSDFVAEVLPGSQIRLAWDADGATSWSLEAVGTGGASADLGSGTGNGGEVVTAIPSSATPSYRLTLSNDAGDTVEQIARPDNVVVSTLDYDPYDAAGAVAQTAIEGTLREVVANAAPGSVVGFASDISTIELPGVDIYRGVSPVADAHLVIDKDITISGPAGSPITLQGASNQPEGHDSVELTWHSRIVYVAQDVTAELENLVLTGGDFIYYGAGINNDGTLTITNVTITGNRAFGTGGGIRNTSNGVLTIVDSVIDDNAAFTADDEVGVDWEIRGVPGTTDGLTSTPEGNGGGIRNDAGGQVTITNSQITNNHARFSGGGINNAGTLTITGSTIDNNEADFTQYTSEGSHFSYGGGIMNGGTGTLDVTGGSISGNSSAEQGGGVWHHANATTTLTDADITGNTAGAGGVTGYGGGIMQHYYTGELDTRLTTSGLNFVPANTPTDTDSHDAGVRPAGAGAAEIDLLEFRLAPLPPALR